jgi:regulator of protease activity HflC (stomatin/prohibitin superfamily)
MPKATTPLDNIETLEEKKIKYTIRLIALGVISFIIVILLFGTFYTVQAGERVIVLTFRNPSSNIMGPGLHMKIPIVQSIVRMNIRTQTITFDNKQGKGDASEYSSLFAASSDLQDTQIATVVNYHIEEKDVLQIYNQYGDMHSYQINILEPLIRDSVKSVSATYTAEDLVKKRAEFSDKVAEMLKIRFEQKSALFERVNIVNFQFSDEFTKAIERKVTAEQNALTEKNNLERVKYEAEQRIAQAEGEAKAIQIQTAAINSQGGKDYVELKRIEKWDGKLPIVSGSSSIVDLRTATSIVSSPSSTTQ